MKKVNKEELENVSGGVFIIPDSEVPAKPGIAIRDIKATHMEEAEKDILGDAFAQLAKGIDSVIRDKIVGADEYVRELRQAGQGG